MKKGLFLILVFFMLTVGIYFLRTKNPALTETAVQQIFLEIGEPVDRTTVSNSALTIKGKTVMGADVFINDKELKADAAGNFSTTLILDEGENAIMVTANDGRGNYTEKELTVTLESK